MLYDYVSAKLPKKLQVQLTCNGQLAVYDRTNNKLVSSMSLVNISSNFTIHPGTQVLAVRCRNYHSKPWIIGSASNGLVTDKRWKCFSLPKHEVQKSNRWAKDGFDDSHWAKAVAIYSNRQDSPWGKVPDISDEAFWISTADEKHSRLFCRSMLSDLLQKQSTYLPRGILLVFYCRGCIITTLNLHLKWKKKKKKKRAEFCFDFLTLK